MSYFSSHWNSDQKRKSRLTSLTVGNFSHYFRVNFKILDPPAYESKYINLHHIHIISGQLSFHDQI